MKSTSFLKKEPRKFNIVILIVLIALTILVGAFYFWQIQSTKSEVANLDKQISMTKETAAKQEKSADKNESQMSISLLKDAVDWANTYPVQTIPIMQHLTSLLPERGFIQSFTYAEAGTVILTVQFDSAREAAYFLDNLGESEWVGEPTLNSLTVEKKEEEESTATKSANEEGAEANEAQTPEQTSTPAATTNIENKLNTNDLYLPRYIGQFEIKLNMVKIKEITSKSNEEGVTSS
ncbi:Tfp pilus assembly protein PilN [Neobacillus niacini]|uniref:PilN domain-containing protein n=1 Tax=Neobacillus niacini TaxID=86668 RepID=UPI0027883A39|nr:PilN domain-containing protein [Neobacillus niacini]MDQ1001334.1 Tfp pilus assembly protein PilN [Neobacillus niacini]